MAKLKTKKGSAGLPVRASSLRHIVHKDLIIAGKYAVVTIPTTHTASLLCFEKEDFDNLKKIEEDISNAIIENTSERVSIIDSLYKFLEIK